ncbi:MAG: 23S rRNA (guanosine(2251)-2'-O)-methyltransferase RlmB [Clostridiales bacterium]|nr:23S rRNA (guanosine(2251)-2'-O)-methyltransferase RlmB [Clostridiales bacterium]
MPNDRFEGKKNYKSTNKGSYKGSNAGSGTGSSTGSAFGSGAGSGTGTGGKSISGGSRAGGFSGKSFSGSGKTFGNKAVRADESTRPGRTARFGQGEADTGYKKPGYDRGGSGRPEGGRPEGGRAEGGRPEGGRSERPAAGYGKSTGTGYGKSTGAGFGKTSGGSYGKSTGGGFGKSTGNKPAYGKPAYDKPAYDKPAYDKPAFEKPEGGRPSYGKPAFEKPAYSRPERENTRLRREEVKPEWDDAADEDRDPDSNERIEGRNPVLEALKSGRSINKIFVAKGETEGSINQIIAMAREKKIIIQDVSRSKLDSMTETFAHQGVIAYAAAREYVEVERLLEIAKESGRPAFIIILDEITDSYNLGSVLRSANAAGAHGVIIPKRRAVGLTATVAKASAGAIEHVPVARVTNIGQTIEQLKKEGVWVVGTDSNGEKAYYDFDYTSPVAIVIGSEGEGIRRLVRESCDVTVNIPMKGSVNSLNAAIAGAVVMFEVMKQREIKK